MIERLDGLRDWLLARSAEGHLGFGLAAVAVVTLLAYAAFRAVRFAFGRLYERVGRWRGTRIGPLRVGGQEILSADDTTVMLVGGVRVLRLAVDLGLAYLYLNLVFRLFPATRAVSDRLLDYLVDAVEAIASGVVGYLPSLFFLLVLFFAARWMVRVTGAVFQRVASGQIRIHSFDPEWAGPTFKILRFAIIAVVAVVAFPYLPGSTSPAFQGLSIFLGVLVSLGSSGAVADVISGIVLTYTRAFRIGDRVKIADAVGDVVEKTLFVTRVRTVKNVDITIPNSLVMSNHIVNFSAQAANGTGLILHTGLTLGYDVPWQKVHEALRAAAADTEGVLDAPEPFVLQTALDDFYVHYELNAYTRDAQAMGATYSELHRHMLDRCHAAGIEIASPHLSAVRDGNALQVPDPYLPKDYRPASFRIRWPGQERRG